MCTTLPKDQLSATCNLPGPRRVCTVEVARPGRWRDINRPLYDDPHRTYVCGPEAKAVRKNSYSSMEAHRAITRALLEDGQSPLIRTKENGQSPYGVLYTCNVDLIIRGDEFVCILHTCNVWMWLQPCEWNWRASTDTPPQEDYNIILLR